MALWDAQAGILLGSVEHAANVNSIAFAPDGHTLATASNDKTIALWDAGTFTRRRVLRHASRVNEARYSPDGSMLASASADTSVAVWDVSTGVQLQAFDTDGNATHVAFASELLTAAVAEEDEEDDKNDAGFLYTWRVGTGELIRKQRVCGHYSSVHSLELDPGRTRLLVCCGGGDAPAWIIDLQTGVPLHAFDAHTVQWSPDGTRVLALARNATIYDAQTGAALVELAVADEETSYAATWTPDGAHVVTGDDNSMLVLWDASSGERMTAADARPGAAWSLTFDPAEPTRVVLGGVDGEDSRANSALAVWQLH